MRKREEEGGVSDLDVLIIGTGTAGQSAAYDLKKRGLTIGMADQSANPLAVKTD